MKQIANLATVPRQRDGFSVQMLFPLAVRYREADRTITMFPEPHVHDRPWASFLPTTLRAVAVNTSIDVMVEKPIVWDNSERHPPTLESTGGRGIGKNRKQAQFPTKLL